MVAALAPTRAGRGRFRKYPNSDHIWRKIDDGSNQFWSFDQADAPIFLMFKRSSRIVPARSCSVALLYSICAQILVDNNHAMMANSMLSCLVKKKTMPNCRKSQRLCYVLVIVQLNHSLTGANHYFEGKISQALQL